jgi:hypothetical protein
MFTSKMSGTLSYAETSGFILDYPITAASFGLPDFADFGTVSNL